MPPWFAAPMRRALYRIPTYPRQLTYARTSRLFTAPSVVHYDEPYAADFSAPVHSLYARIPPLLPHLRFVAMKLYLFYHTFGSCQRFFAIKWWTPENFLTFLYLCKVYLITVAIKTKALCGRAALHDIALTHSNDLIMRVNSQLKPCILVLLS